MEKVYIIQASLVSHAELNALFGELLPDVKIHNLVDDSLLFDVMQNGGINDKVISRMRAYVQAAANNGARSAGKTVEIVEFLVDRALEVLLKEQNREKHNAMVLDTVKQAASACDVIVLTQGEHDRPLARTQGDQKASTDKSAPRR